MQTQAHGLTILFQALLRHQKEVNKWGNTTGGPGSRKANKPSLDRAITQVSVCGKCLGKSRAGMSKISASRISRELEINWNNVSVPVCIPSGMQKLLNLWKPEHLQKLREIWNLSKRKHVWTWLWNLPLRTLWERCKTLYTVITSASQDWVKKN